jgi:EmrB/QacA subfamily drug resistance transporter
MMICCLSLLIVGLDTTILNVALPSLQNDLGASVSGLQWSIDAYTLVVASLLMLAGSTADRIGRRRIFQTGLALFSLASLLCSVAPGLGWLIGFRALQGIGASMLNPVAMSIITNTFTDRKERAQAIGVWGGVVGVSIALGPILGGVLVSSVGWRSIFLINVPIGVVGLILTALYVPESKAQRARRVDPVGQVLIMLGLASLIYAIIEAPRLGWGSPTVPGLLVVAAASVIALVSWELRRPEPLLDVRFFRSATFSGATVIAVCAFGAFAGFLFVNTLYLQDELGLSPLKAGVYLIPMAVMTVICAPLSGRLVGTYGTRPSLLTAGVAMTTGTVLLTGIRANTGTWLLILSYLIFGIGFGMVNAPITNTAVSGMPISQAGVAAAVASTSRQVGSALGVAVVGSVYTSQLSGGRLAAAHAGWWIVAGCSVAVLLIGLLSSGRWAQASAARMAGRLAEADGGQPGRPVTSSGPVARTIDLTERAGGMDPGPWVSLSTER